MRIALGIEYNGHDFYGWQAQQNLVTVQGCLEIALSQIANEPINVFCAGRTDAGVHASGQVIHFDTQSKRDSRAWILGTNTLLPPTISVRWAQEMDNEFHARFSAVYRRYRYVIHNHSTRSALFSNRVTWFHPHLNAEEMHEAAQYLLGELDFSSFRSSQCESKTPMRNVQEISVKRHGDFIVVEIQANAFLHHMVRNIVGVLLEVGTKKRPPIWALEVLHAKDRRMAAETAPAEGLYLIQVGYPEAYCLPIDRNSIVLI